LFIIIDATDRKAVCSVVVVTVTATCVEVSVSGVDATYRAAPQVAVAAYVVEYGIVVVPIASKHELKNINCTF